VRQVGYLQELTRDSRSTEHKKRISFSHQLTQPDMCQTIMVDHLHVMHRSLEPQQFKESYNCVEEKCTIKKKLGGAISKLWAPEGRYKRNSTLKTHRYQAPS
jgi:hypothetical protein